ncbi:MAG: hypothetical protein ABWZ66_09810 [Pyrinomonadaceae bacterium]
MKISGHTKWKTFMRYVKLDDDTMIRAKIALDDYLEKLHNTEEKQDAKGQNKEQEEHP